MSTIIFRLQYNSGSKEIPFLRGLCHKPLMSCLVKWNHGVVCQKHILYVIPGHFRGQAFRGVMSSPSGVGKYHIWYAKCFIWINKGCCSQGTPGTWIVLHKLVDIVTCQLLAASPIGPLTRPVPSTQCGRRAVSVTRMHP